MVAILWILFGVALVMALIGPRRVFRMQAPMMKHPEAREASDLGYYFTSTIQWGLVVAIGIAALIVTLNETRSYQREDVQLIVYDASRDLENGSEGLIGAMSVEEAVAQHGDLDRLHIQEIPLRADPTQDGTTSHWQVSNSEGEHPFCLAVTRVIEVFGEDADVSVETSEGPCV